MINTNERLRILEKFSGKELHVAIPEMPLDQSRARELFKRRQAMLESIDRNITPAFYDALRAKIEYEHSYLLGVVESSAKLAEARKRLNKILKAEYFIQKPLDTNIF